MLCNLSFRFFFGIWGFWICQFSNHYITIWLWHSYYANTNTCRANATKNRMRALNRALINLLVSFRLGFFSPAYPFTTVDLSATVNNSSLHWTHSLRAQGEVSLLIRHTVGSLLFKKEKKTYANCGFCRICTDLRVSLQPAHGHVSGDTWWCKCFTAASACAHCCPSVLICSWIDSTEGTLEANKIPPPPRNSVCFFPFTCCFLAGKKHLLNICNKHSKGAGMLIWGQPRQGRREMGWQRLSTV